jgi:hypothetical protein
MSLYYFVSKSGREHIIDKQASSEIDYLLTTGRPKFAVFIEGHLYNIYRSQMIITCPTIYKKEQFKLFKKDTLEPLDFTHSLSNLPNESAAPST